MPEGKHGVLEWLAQQAGSPYLSDLRPAVRTPACTRALRRALGSVEPERWSARAWADAVAYLLDAYPGALTPEEAVALLLKKL